MSSFFKTPKWENKKYINFVESLPCVCESSFNPCMGDIVAHHISGFEKYKGIGLKPHDSLTMPMCFKHHNEFHEASNPLFTNADQFRWAMETLDEAIRRMKAGELVL